METLTDERRQAEVYEQSQREWVSTLQAIGDNERLPTYSTQLDQILGPTPRYTIPSDLGESTKLLTEELYIQGTSNWEVGDGSCELKTKTISHRLVLATRTPALLTCTNDMKVEQWFGKEAGKDSITILVLAWAYILSARWTEIAQEQGIHLDWSMVYVNSRTSAALDLECGDIDPAGARWWQAVLSTAWRASFNSHGIICHSPWAIRLEHSDPERDTGDACDEVHPPPSSEQALEYLAEYCAIHHLEEQCLAALSASLFIPLKRRSGIHCPPLRAPPMSRPGPSPTARGSIIQQGKLLPYYMTISSNTWGLQALMHGTFFNPAVNCNELSAWLRPICKAIEPAIRNGNGRQVAILMAKRYPRLAPLWAGALLSGAAQSFMEPISRGLFAVCLATAGWTATRHSFIGPIEPRIEPLHQHISRAEEATLLYLTQETTLPVCPWKPFGYVHLQETALEVQQHARCSPHFFRYSSWRWKGTTSVDVGFRSDVMSNSSDVSQDIAFPAKEAFGFEDDELSRTATTTIFGWLRRDGWLPCEAYIYRHEWFKEDSDEEEIENEGSSVDSIKSN